MHKKLEEQLCRKYNLQSIEESNSEITVTIKFDEYGDLKIFFDETNTKLLKASEISDQ